MIRSVESERMRGKNGKGVGMMSSVLGGCEPLKRCLSVSAYIMYTKGVTCVCTQMFMTLYMYRCVYDVQQISKVINICMRVNR